jgi:hypothetical protein
MVMVCVFFEARTERLLTIKTSFDSKGLMITTPEEAVLNIKERMTFSALLNLNSVNQLIFVMVKCGVLFEVRTELLNITYLNKLRL